MGTTNCASRDGARRDHRVSVFFTNMPIPAYSYYGFFQLAGFEPSRMRAARF